MGRFGASIFLTMAPQTHSCLVFPKSLVHLPDFRPCLTPFPVSVRRPCPMFLWRTCRLLIQVTYATSTAHCSLKGLLSVTSVFLREAGRTLSTCMTSQGRNNVEPAESLSGSPSAPGWREVWRRTPNLPHTPFQQISEKGEP